MKLGISVQVNTPFILAIIFSLLAAQVCFAEIKFERSADYYNDLGIKYGKNNELSTAIKFFRKATELDPKFVSAYINLGIVYVRAGDYDKAAESLQKALALSPRRASIYINLGAISEIKGNYNEAVKYTHKALALDPMNVTAINNLGNLYLKQGNKALALKQCQKLREIKESALADILQDKINKAAR